MKSNIDKGMDEPGADKALLLVSVTQTSDGDPTRFDEKAMFFSKGPQGRTVRIGSAKILTAMKEGAVGTNADAGLRTFTERSTRLN